MDDEPAASTPPSLAAEQKQLTRDRIGRAAMIVVARRGFDATVEEIARESGVSPRTIFRHYATQGSLILATVKDMFEACGRRPIDGLPVLEEDLDGWLEVLAVTVHTRNAEILGQAFWDLHAAHSGDSLPLAEVAALRRRARRRGVSHLAIIVWSAVGGMGEPPDDVVSAFATQALMVDFDKTPEEIGRLSAESLKLILRHSIDEQRPSDPTPIGGPGSPGMLAFQADDMAASRAMPPGGQPS